MNIRKAITEYTTGGLLPWYKALGLYVKNRKVKSQRIRKNNWHKYKKSNTLFLLGCGPSISNITASEWDVINRHDSMGLNHAFLIKKKTTYYFCGYEPSSNVSLLTNFTEEIRPLYEKSLWFVHMKSFYRLYHPRIVPEMFPPNARLCYFDYPDPIVLDSDRQFDKADFQKSLIYRGVMCFGLHLADCMEYSNIVLLGVDLHTYKHFFDHYSESAKERKAYNEEMEKITGGPFESMIPKGKKYRTMEEYYYAVNDLYFQPKNVNLYVGNRDNMLSPRIPYYPEFENIVENS